MVKRIKHRTVSVKIGGLAIGGGYPVVIQSMTDTDTANPVVTAKQVIALAKAGAEMVRVAINNEAAACAIPEICQRIEDVLGDFPLIGDFHFNGHELLRKYPKTAARLAKFRINPGTIGKKGIESEHFVTFIKIAKDNNRPIRIGVNAGSLQKLVEEKRAHAPFRKEQKTADVDIIVRAALEAAQQAEKHGLAHDQIVLSAKVSKAEDLWAIYEKLAAQCDFPLHLGLTEAGVGIYGAIASATALTPLLVQGIGDTIRVSIVPPSGEGRTFEVKIAQSILQSLGLRYFSPKVIACPGCGRTKAKIFQKMAFEIQKSIHKKMPIWRKQYPGIEKLNVAVMGCVVNGPGESKQADIGLYLLDNAKEQKAQVFVDGVLHTTLSGTNICEDFIQLIEEHAKHLLLYGK